MKLDDDDFTLFGLTPKFGIDRQEVDARWRALQAQVHPDRFAAQGPSAQRQAMQWAVRVNEAHRRLRDPLARAAYLCELRGARVDADRHTAMPTQFLMQQMAWREALEDAGSADQVEALDLEVGRQEKALQTELARYLDESLDLEAAVGAVRSLMFLGRFRADIQRRMEALES
ncbi:MAG: Fe-S protein assembly co-chaperone HscB [Betaproteobacteria bacterium]